MTVHVVGNACIDTTFRIDRFPEAGETLNAISHFDGLGGKGANQAMAAARTGARVEFWSAIGRDAEGDRIRAMLQADLAGDVGAAHLTVLELPTDRSTIALDAAGENRILSGVACARAFDPLRATTLQSDVRPHDVVVLQGNLQPDVTAACLRAARAKGARTILNASPIGPGGIPDLGSIDLACVDVLIVNEGEACALSRAGTAPQAAATLLDRGAGLVIVSLGARGCLSLDRHDARPLIIPAPVVEVADTSGAGDVLCGVFAGCLSQGLAPPFALGIAVRASALAVTKAGTGSSCPSADDLTLLMKTA